MKQLLGFLLIFSILCFSNCKSTQATQSESTSVSPQPTGKPTSLVKASDLETFLPQEVLGIPRTQLTGEKTEILDKNVTMASAEYKNAEQVLRITITDATNSAAGLTGLAPWIKGDVNNKMGDGYERTAEIEGFKGYESYAREDQTGQTSIVVNNRFVVSVVGEKVAEGDSRAALKSVNLKKLANLR